MSVLNRVRKELLNIEEVYNVKIIYACESGSRAWGFPSKDSDYDVRFLYIHPEDWYLSLLEIGQTDDCQQERRDVIEKPIDDDLDINGWDLRKALQLFRKSNPPLMEWLNSPIVYRETSHVQRLRDLIPIYYSQTASTYHYLHMAAGNHRNYLLGDTIWVKKYFYVLRPLLAIIWMEQGRGVVPTDFNVMLDKLELNQNLKSEIQNLILSKMDGEELRIGDRNEIISGFIESELNRLNLSRHNYGKPQTEISELEYFFRSVLNE